MGVQMPTPHAEASAHGYALERDAAGPFLRPIEGEEWFARPGVPARPGLHSRPGLITNYYTRPLLIEEGEEETEPPPEEVRSYQRARISRRYVRDQERQQPIAFFGPAQQAASSSSRPAQPVDQQRNAQVVKRKLGPMAKGMAKKRARR